MIHYQGRWAVVTGASSGLGRGLAAGLADRGMSLVLTGRNEARLDETAHRIRRAAPSVKVETVAADLSSRSGVSALLDHVGDRPIEVLVSSTCWAPMPVTRRSTAARRPRARHHGWATRAGQRPSRGHSRRAEQGDRRQRPVHAARVAHPVSGGLLRPASRPPARRSRFTTRSWLPPRPNACGIC